MANPFQFRLTGLLLNLWATLEIRDKLKQNPPSLFSEQTRQRNKIDVLKLKAQINTMVISRQNIKHIPWSWETMGEAA
jgi:hypothetical protein